MKKLCCIIVDDEPDARKVLNEFAGQVRFLEVMGNFEDAAKAENFLKSHDPDLIFLDIELPRISGLQWLQQLKTDAMIILTTAFPKYALHGYEWEIVDYLLKPIAFDRFMKAVYKARDYHQLLHTANRLLHEDFIFVKSDKRIEKIELDDLIYAESIGNYVSIYTRSKKIVAYLTVRSLESQLPVGKFIRIHQSYLVNYTKIDAIEGNEIRIGGRSLPIARNSRDLVMTMIDKRLIRR